MVTFSTFANQPSLPGCHLFEWRFDAEIMVTLLCSWSSLCKLKTMGLGIHSWSGWIWLGFVHKYTLLEEALWRVSLTHSPTHSLVPAHTLSRKHFTGTHYSDQRAMSPPIFDKVERLSVNAALPAGVGSVGSVCVCVCEWEAHLMQPSVFEACCSFWAVQSSQYSKHWPCHQVCLIM